MQTHRCGPPSKVSAPPCFPVSSLPCDGSSSDTGHRVNDHDRFEGQAQLGENVGKDRDETSPSSPSLGARHEQCLGLMAS